MSYLSPLSSLTINAKNTQMIGTKYTINASIFEIESANDTFTVLSPRYVKEAVPKDLTIFADVRSFIDKDDQYQYNIYQENASKTHLRLYLYDDAILIASYADNTADGSEIIMSICKIVK